MKPKYHPLTISSDLLGLGISATDTMLLAEITALTKRTGYCYAAKTYFADRFIWSKSTVYESLSRLEKMGFIRRQNRIIHLVTDYEDSPESNPASPESGPGTPESRPFETVRNPEKTVRNPDSTVRNGDSGVRNPESVPNRVLNTALNTVIIKDSCAIASHDTADDIELFLDGEIENPKAKKKAEKDAWKASDYGFDEFWDKHWRKKVDPVDARRAWKALAPSPELVAQIARYVDERFEQDEEWRVVEDGKKKFRKYCPSLGPFIRRKRWLDDWKGEGESSFGGDEPTAEIVWPGTELDRRNPEFNPGKGWRQSWGQRADIKGNVVKVFTGWEREI